MEARHERLRCELRDLSASTRVKGNQRRNDQDVVWVGNLEKGAMQTFGPKTVTIKAGQSVIFKNADVGMAHSVLGEKGEFASPMLAPGAAFEKRFDQKGVIHFQCAPHPQMKGTFIVK